MNVTLQPTTPPEPFFHEASNAVRFWVGTQAGTVVGASITKQTLHFRFRADTDSAHAVAAYLSNRAAIDSAVHRRLAQGSLDPVLLREADFA
jgi:hypothetical protein